MHRQGFGAGEEHEVTDKTDIASEFDTDDIPLLTEMVRDGQQPSHTTATTLCPSEAAITKRIEEAVREQIAHLLIERQSQLANEIETWLDEKMPQLVISAMDGITDHLVSILANRTRDELLPRLESVMQRTAEDKPGSDSSE